MPAPPAAPERVDLDAGTIHYRDSGSGPTIVFAHGLLVDGSLWRKVTPLLDGEFRCVVPDLPLGSHREAMKDGADLTPPGVARILADFMGALELDDVTLVGNDTGGAICQLVAANHPERLGRLVLTPCDAYENFLPPFFRPMQYAAKVPGLLTALVQPVRLRAVQKGPLAYGMLISPENIDPDVLDSWVRPYLSDGGVARRDRVPAVDHQPVHDRGGRDTAELRSPNPDRVGTRGPLLQASLRGAARGGDPERAPRADRGLPHLRLRGPAGAPGRADRLVRARDGAGACDGMSEADLGVRSAGAADAEVIGRLLHDFNTEYDEITPGPEAVANRVRELLAGEDFAVLLGGSEPRGLVVLRFRPSIWTPGLECYVAELYVQPEHRRQGLGLALMNAALMAARAQGADYVEVATSEDDTGARALYERLGFVNRERGPDGPVMLVYEREL